MIINVDSLATHLREKVRPMQSDASRHLLCPCCGMRTKLSTLGDGRRKCTACGKKFRVHKVSDENKLRQCAEILLCFCLDFSLQRTVHITRHRYRLVATYYGQFRKLLAEKSVPQEKKRLLSVGRGSVHARRGKSRCLWCKGAIRFGEATPVFGVQMRDGDEMYIDPLQDDEAMLHFHTSGTGEETPGRREGCVGYICCGKFHRFAEEEGAADSVPATARTKDGTEQLWTWIRERVPSHHRMWKRNTGYFLKELEWKYNNRSVDPDVQARKIVEWMPVDFLTQWSLVIKKGKRMSPVQ